MSKVGLTLSSEERKEQITNKHSHPRPEEKSLYLAIVIKLTWVDLYLRAWEAASMHQCRSE